MTLFHFKDTYRLLYPVRVLAFGLLVSQTVATAVLWISNHALSARLTAVAESGFHALPGLNIDPPLASFRAAFAGGVFFTLSIGTGIVLLAFGTVLLLQAVKPGACRRAAWAGAVVVWLAIIMWGNANGVCYPLTAFLVVIPPAVVLAALQWSPLRHGIRALPWRKSIHVFFVVILLCVWAPQVNKNLFLDIKDNLLLPTRPGTGVVNFYYRYTLFPAELLKPFAARQVNTFAVEGVDDIRTEKEFENLLLHNNCFPVADPALADLVVRKDGNRITLSHDLKPVVVTDMAGFRRFTAALLLKFSKASDSKSNFRKFTKFCLTWLAPMVLYFAVFAFFSIMPGLFLPLRFSSILVPFLCCVVLAGVVTFGLRPDQAGSMDMAVLNRMLMDGTRWEKIAALKYMFENKVDIARVQGLRKLLDTPDYAQRYWIIRNLGNSRHPGVIPLIVRLIKSEPGYLACKAIEAAGMAMGIREREFVKDALVNKLQSSRHWYVQYYAYTVLRKMGWVPARSG